MFVYVYGYMYVCCDKWACSSQGPTNGVSVCICMHVYAHVYVYVYVW
jgi:hypothetical protein